MRSISGGAIVSVTQTSGLALRSSVRLMPASPGLLSRSMARVGRQGYLGLMPITMPSSPVFRRTFVPKGYTESCSTRAFITSLGKAVRSLFSSSRTASCGNKRRQYGRGLTRASNTSTRPMICASSLICRPFNLLGYPCPIQRSCACSTTSASHSYDSPA